MFGFIPLTEPEVKEMLEIMTQDDASHKKFMFTLINNNDIIAFGLSILISFVIDPVIIATIYGGSILKFLLATYFSYMIANYIINGGIYYTYIAIKFASTRKLKLKVTLNSILNSAFHVGLLTIALFLFVFVLRINTLQFAAVVNDKYNVPFEDFKAIFKHVPFVVLHFAFLFGI
ncbi:MAG: hypothetical protein HPY87_09065 [Fervidobacterium sp.]|uniref:hypothetical protein n=1 Tax=Fervidobacterium sp. TaxID=1871331 RepID=UPI0025BF0D58|nr:hypothetical protein [Fervidobacterium sp.]NPU90011.1 hypothetical protein [Fervidobacterium sp.]